MSLNATEVLRRFPLRLAITDYCNLWCIFCSNEGMDVGQRSTTHVDVGHFEYLLATAIKHGLVHLSLTGGEPTLHPRLDHLLHVVTNSDLERTFFHTNGVALTPELICGPLKSFTKVAVSIHAVDYSTWRRITSGTKKQYARLWTNLHMLGEMGYGTRLEIKHIPVRGLNDSIEAIRGTLELCARYGAQFKFLTLEPIEREHLGLVVSLPELADKLESAGCTQLRKDVEFRGQSDYLPLNWYLYRGARGVALEIGCGKPQTCQTCYTSNETFMTPRFDLKPCHVDQCTVSLKEAINTKSELRILEAVSEARKILRTRPGESVQFWRQGGSANA